MISIPGTGSTGSFWDRLVKELQSPWDWAAAAGGAAAGAVGSTFTAGADGGTLTAGGALGAVALRKAAATSLRGRQLRKSAIKLGELLGRCATMYPEAKHIAEELQVERELLDNNVISLDEFALKLNDIIERYRSTCTKKQALSTALMRES